MNNLAGSILDITVLENSVRNWINAEGVAIYKRLPGAMAQQVAASIKDDFTGFFKATKVFNHFEYRHIP